MKLSTEQIQLLAIRLAYVLDQCSCGMLLQNNDCNNANGLHQYELIAGWEPKEAIQVENNSWQNLQNFYDKHKGEWMMGSLAYDLKNQIEALHSNNTDQIEFPLLHFFIPRKLIVVDAHGNVLHGKQWVEDILNGQYEQPLLTHASVSIQAKVSKEEYLQAVERIKSHIIEGDVYELNYCIEFFSKNVVLNPTEVYNQLQHISPAPFAAFYKLNDKALLCASPERFLLKKEELIHSQPIKGTTKRGSTTEMDNQLKAALLNSEKERAENLMIVDLVRNDLAKSAKTGSVKVDELFGIYSFAQVHQMISTVSAQHDNNTHVVDIIKHAFPMGSMTGAPKIKAMELIEEYETTKRGLYSGCVGYITPDGDFDFNVVIRSIQYNAKNSYVSFMVGSAITFDSIAEQEYEECLLKAQALVRVLNQGRL